VVNLARHLNVDPEQALSDANRKFERRFRSMESAAKDGNLKLSNLDIDALESRWQEAKKKT
jgi:ATP diphosphatase